MPWGPRVIETSSNIAEGDKLYLAGQYSGPSGLLTAFMPVYKDVSDAAEYGYIGATANQITVGPLAKLQSAGRVTVAGSGTGNTQMDSGAVSSGQVPIAIGVYSPTNINDTPSTGDVIRITRFGVTPVQISGGQAPAIGDFILGDYQQALALTRTNTTGGAPSLGAYLGRVVATQNQISLGQAPTLQAFKFGFLVNGWIDK